MSPLDGSYGKSTHSEWEHDQANTKTTKSGKSRERLLRAKGRKTDGNSDWPTQLGMCICVFGYHCGVQPCIARPPPF